MIEVRQLSYVVGKKTLLEDISFQVGEGEHVSIIGANGAGKSTLLKLLCKELVPTRGDIEVKGKNLFAYSLKELAKFRSVLSQQNTLSVSFTVYELVLMGRYPHFEQRPSVRDLEIIQRVMEETGITLFRDRQYNSLSGGEQQRVQLARVIAQIYDQPQGLLFLDEPTNGLDLLYQQQILDLARSLANQGFSVVSVLHDINAASRYADQILILKQGKKIAFGTPGDVVTNEYIQEAFNVQVTLMESGASGHPVIVPSAILNR